MPDGTWLAGAFGRAPPLLRRSRFLRDRSPLGNRAHPRFGSVLEMKARLRPRLWAGLLAVVALSLGLVPASVSASETPSTIISSSGVTYRPVSVNGATDDYHCTLIDPHTKSGSFIVASQFVPHSPEVHHAILALVPASLAAKARQADHHGKGWTCFGQPGLPPSDGFTVLPWLTVWVPGQRIDPQPAGTGVLFPKGSLLLEQVHYNLLRGDKPVRASVRLTTVPTSQHLAPLSIGQLVAPPDVPCAAGISGPLCSRSASLADLGHRFGPGSVLETDFIERGCGHDPANPPEGVTTTCTFPLGAGKKILAITAHMHLTGRAFRVVLNPGTSHAKTLVNVTNYNFDDQRAYPISPPVVTHSGDTISLSCTYDPKLRQELPQLRKQPPRFVVWGDGSSDEMCMAITKVIAAPGS